MQAIFETTQFVDIFSYIHELSIPQTKNATIEIGAQLGQ